MSLAYDVFGPIVTPAPAHTPEPKYGRASALWTAERIDTLKKLWAENWSATEIAKVLGCFGHCRDGGRSAVCGKLSRMGLMRVRMIKPPAPKPERKKPSLNFRQPPALHTTEAERLDQAAAAFEATDLPAELAPNAKPLLALADNECRWPVRGDGAGMMFCAEQRAPFGDERAGCFPYCARHVGLAYTSRPAA